VEINCEQLGGLSIRRPRCVSPPGTEGALGRGCGCGRTGHCVVGFEGGRHVANQPQLGVANLNDPPVKNTLRTADQRSYPRLATDTPTSDA
jgi:hypothetical protein